MIRALASAGVNLKKQAPDGLAPIHRAAQQGQAGSIDLLVELGVKPDSRSATGAAAIHFAAKESKYDALTLLLELGADPALPIVKARLTEPDDVGRTALHYAASTGAKITAKRLIAAAKAKGAAAQKRIMNAVDHLGRTPIDISERGPVTGSEHGNEVLELLKRAGARRGGKILPPPSAGEEEPEL